ncbi:MAG: acylneuraminate cytidylyltransferase family protein [Agarilytica sp.]
MTSVLCVISARGGSQGVPGKNIRPLLGRPVIARAVETALRAPEIDRVLISTDSQAIADEATAAGAQVLFMRPPELADSTSGKFQVWQHALATCEEMESRSYDLYVDIDCTNPLIETSDISNTIALFLEKKQAGVPVDAVFTVSNARRNPYFNLVEPDSAGRLKMSKSKEQTVLSRQKAPPVFEHVAGVYVLDPAYLKRANHLLEGHAEGYELPEEKALDIDSELDFLMIEYLLKRRFDAAADTTY